MARKKKEPISIYYLNNDVKSSTIQVETLDECFKEIRKYTVEHFPESNFLKFIEDSSILPRIGLDCRYLFIEIDDVCILRDTNSVAFDFGDWKRMAVVSGISFKDIVDKILERSE